MELKRYMRGYGDMEEYQYGQYVFYEDAYKAIRASEELCKLYFEIASNLIGEDEVRRLRDQKLKSPTVDREQRQGED